MFLHVSKIRKMMVIPTDILNDPNVSVGAKGLYIQLYYSNDSICSLEELTTYVNNTKEELTKYFEELTENGYIIIGDKKCEMLQKAVSSKSSKRTDTAKATEYAETTQPKKLSIYEKMTGLVNSYDLPTNVKQLLIVYFEQRLAKKGRFSEADDLHGYVVNAMIGELISFHLSEEDQITCIQQSIDKQWFKFVNPVNVVANVASNNATFDKTKLKSGSYTEEEKEKIMEQLAQLNSSNDSDSEGE